MTENLIKLSPADLAALLCARVCHDLVSPISALGTALEVLDDEGATDMHGDALDLVRLSARQASGKLQFLRLAFGAGGSAPGEIGRDMLIALVDGIYGGGKAEIVWDPSVDTLNKSEARLLLNMTMMAVQSVPRGGRVTIAAGQDIVLTAKGPKARLDAAVERTLSGRAPEDGFDGRTIQPFYTGMIARELKTSVDASIIDETVTFSAHIPQKEEQSAA